MAKTTFWKEFKDFIAKGNVIDMAIGVVIGNAFKAIASSLVADIITPLISLLTGKASFNDLVYVLKEGTPAVLADDGTVITEEIAAVTLNYGTFIQYIIDFIIIALSIFIVIKVATSLKNRSEKLREKLDAENFAKEQKAAEEAAAAKQAEEEAAAKAAADEKADIEAARAAQQETAKLLADIKELLANK